MMLMQRNIMFDLVEAAYQCKAGMMLMQRNITKSKIKRYIDINAGQGYAN
jgi:hypothetical protein